MDRVFTRSAEACRLRPAAIHLLPSPMGTAGESPRSVAIRMRHAMGKAAGILRDDQGTAWACCWVFRLIAAFVEEPRAATSLTKGLQGCSHA